MEGLSLAQLFSPPMVTRAHLTPEVGGGDGEAGRGGGWRFRLLLPKETVAKSNISVVIPTNLMFLLEIVFIYVHAEIHRNIEHFTKLLIKRLTYK
jgi:hypothetical protein